MRTLLLTGLCFASLLLCAQTEPEIVIEMTGSPTPAAQTGVDVFSKNAAQLKKFFRGKTRQYVLYESDTVSTQDVTLYSAIGKEYAFVRFGKENQDYRKFLFKEQDPQVLLDVADNAQTTLALNQKYQITMPLSQQEFVRVFPQAIEIHLTDMANATQYDAYTVANTWFLVFQNGTLVQQFQRAADYTAFIDTIRAANSGYSAQQQQQQTALEKARLERTSPPRRPPHPYYRALLWGGTIEDRMYMPTVISTGNLAPYPLKPGKLPAGTPLLRDAAGNYMNAD